MKTREQDNWSCQNLWRLVATLKVVTAKVEVTAMEGGRCLDG